MIIDKQAGKDLPWIGEMERLAYKTMELKKYSRKDSTGLAPHESVSNVDASSGATRWTSIFATKEKQENCQLAQLVKAQGVNL